MDIKTKKITTDSHYMNTNEYKEYMNTWKEGEIPWEIDDDDTDQNKTTVKKPDPSPILPRPLYTFQRLIVDM